MNAWVKTFEEFLRSADARMRRMREDVTREVKEEISGQLEPGPRGEKGEPGPHGIQGPQGDPGKDGVNGKDGVGIADLRMVEGQLLIRLTDGSEKNVGRVMGERGTKGDPGINGNDGRDGTDGKDGSPGINGKDGADGLNGKDGAPGERGTRGEKGLDGKDGIHGKDGSPGRDGRDGTKGDPGRHGKDGISRKELEEEAARLLSRIEVQGRTWKLGDHDIRMPIPEYLGVWKEGEYEAGDMVSLAGSLWHADRTTKDKPGDGETDWTLAVKRGRDGRDLRSDG